MQRRLCEMSEAKWSITEAKCLQISHNKFASQRDAISPSMGDLILSHSAGMHNTYIYRHFEKIPFRFAPLHLFCIPAYTHQIPNGISSHLLRDDMYIISYLIAINLLWNSNIGHTNSLMHSFTNGAAIIFRMVIVSLS